MRKIILCLFISFTGLILWDACQQDAHSFTSGSPGGYSGSPADGNKTCGSCHGGNASPATQTGLISSTIPVDGYTPGNTYSLTLTADFMGRVKYGFELSAANAAGTNLGGFIHTTTFTQAVVTKNATHKSTGTSAPGGTRTWTLDWTAPAAGTGNVTFYLVLNATNNAGSSSGDVVLKSTLVASEKIDPCVINDVDVTADNVQLCQSAFTLINVANSQAGVSYQLKNAGTNANIGAPIAGNGSQLQFNTGTLTTTTTFKVLATKNATCSQTLTDQPTVAVSNDPVPTITADGPLTFCLGDSVKLTASAGSLYTWSNGKTSSSITVKTAGTYSVSVEYPSGCSVTSASKVVAVQSLPTPQLNLKGPINLCQGDSLTLSTGTFNDYTWNNGKKTKDIVVKTSGSYTVQVVNAAGCKGISVDTAFVNVTSKPSAAISVTGNLTFCEGDSVKLSVPTGNTYLWSTGSTENFIYTKTSGNYSVRVSLGSCSSSSDTVQTTMKALADPVLNFNDTVAICPGDSITLSLISSADQVTWSNGSVSPSITVSDPGNYFVTVKNQFGCTKKSDTVTVVVGNELHPILQSTGSLILCPGKSIKLFTSKFDNYQWSTGSQDSVITVTEPGQYSLTVSTTSGCVGQSDTITVTSEPAPVVTLNQKGLIVACDSLFLEVSNGNYSYLWNTGETTSSIYAKTGGFHFVVVTSPGGCSAPSDTALLVLGNTPHPTITLNAGTFTSSESTGNQWYRSGVKLVGQTGSTLLLGPEDGDYYTICTEGSGVCFDTSNVIKVNRTGIIQQSNQHVQLYPNPAKEKLVISFNTSSFVTLKIFNLLGEEISTFSNLNNTAVVDISNLAPGTYLLKMFFEDGVVTKQFIVHNHD